MIFEYYLANQKVCFIKMAAKHFGRFAGKGIDFDTNFIALPGRFNLFVIVLNARHDTHVQKLKRNI
jgi:hypothetical protein